jgi:hypothetical protein
VAIQLPRVTQNGWLPILDTCGTSHVDNKLPWDGCYDDDMQYISLQIDFMCSRNIVLILYCKLCQKYVCNIQFTLFWYRNLYMQKHVKKYKFNNYCVVNTVFIKPFFQFTLGWKISESSPRKKVAEVKFINSRPSQTTPKSIVVLKMLPESPSEINGLWLFVHTAALFKSVWLFLTRWPEW